MKFGKFIINILVWNSARSTKKRNKTFPPYGKYDEKKDIPYIDDYIYHHKFDVLKAIKDRKNICIIDIHGGSYIFGRHEDQYIFGDHFLMEGYDFVSVDYRPNDGKLPLKDQFDDIYHCLDYLFTHKNELGLGEDKFVITGDSAGGHMALMFAEAICDKEYAKALGYDFKGEKVEACLVNCPVYDFIHLGDHSVKKSGMVRMFGPSYNDKELFALLSPMEHKESLMCPLFVSTCRKDFLRLESLKVKNDFENGKYPFQFFDVDSDTAKHVHNVTSPYKEEGQLVNKAMMEFIDKHV